MNTKSHLLNPAHKCKAISPILTPPVIKQTNDSHLFKSDDVTIEILIKRVSNEHSLHRNTSFSRDELLIEFEKRTSSYKNYAKDRKTDGNINCPKIDSVNYTMPKLRKQRSHIERIINGQENCFDRKQVRVDQVRVSHQPRKPNFRFQVFQKIVTFNDGFQRTRGVNQMHFVC
jgi:hypothetical protein